MKTERFRLKSDLKVQVNLKQHFLPYLETYPIQTFRTDEALMHVLIIEEKRKTIALHYSMTLSSKIYKFLLR